MIIINEVQGSEGWKQARQGCFTASELSAAAGLSKYISRAELLKQKATGIVPEVDDFKQALFNKGHAAEDAARAIAEEIIGDDLSPVTGMIDVQGMKLLASFDGITFDGDVIFEHKIFNANLAAQVTRGILEPHYQLQIDQQMLVSGAKKCLFMTSDGTESKMKYCWIDAPKSFDHILAIWNQFAADLENYTPPAVEVKPQAEAIKALPAVFVQATGMVTASNLGEFKEAATTFIAAIKTELATDDDFAQAEVTVKFCKEAEGHLEATKASVLAQMSTVDEVVRTIDHISSQLRDKRLMLDKLVKSEKELRKAAIVTKASADLVAHIASLEAETKPIRLGVIGKNFGEAIKGLKSLASMQEKVDTALREEKFDADQAAKDVRAKLAWCKDNAAGQSALFPDLQALMVKPMEDFILTITSRVEKQKADEAARLKAQRAAMQAEEERKATAKAQAEEEAKTRAESEAAAIEERRKAAQIAESAQAIRPPVASKVTRINPVARPSDKEIVDAVAAKFGVSFETACDWIIEAAEAITIKEAA